MDWWIWLIFSIVVVAVILAVVYNHIMTKAHSAAKSKEAVAAQEAQRIYSNAFTATGGTARKPDGTPWDLSQYG